jgi:hypothetical protein
MIEKKTFPLIKGVWVSLDSLKEIEAELTADDFVKKIGDNFTYAKIKEAIHKKFQSVVGV